MNKWSCFMRKALLFAAMTALLFVPMFEAQAKGKGFKDVVKHFEANYRAKKTKIPMLGLANFAVKLIRPAGVKGFKLAVFEDQDFSLRPGAPAFTSVMRESYNQDWQPLVQVNSKKDGDARTYIYAKYKGKDVEFAVVTMEAREAVVLEVKFNPDAAARFLENPKIMGISLGNSIRGTTATRSPNLNTSSRPPASELPTATDDASKKIVTVVSDDNKTGQTTTRAALSANNDENNPPLPASSSVASRPIAPKDDTLRIETRLINLNVKAVDRGGKPITHLKKEDFEIYEDGVRQEVAHFKPVNAPVNLVLLMDLSGSTQKKRKPMIEAARNFIDALPKGDKVAVVGFTRRSKVLIEFSDNKEALKRAVGQIKGIGGGTAYYDAMWAALDQLNALGEARKAIVVLTDGEDESLLSSRRETAHTFDDLLGRASEDDVTIYPIYFKASNPYNKLGFVFGGNGSLLGGNDVVRTARKQLELLAEQTGGDVFSAQREDELHGAYRRVANELHTLYSLAYAPDKLKHNGEFRKVAIKVSAKDAVVRSRRGYYDR